ncbi:hypothetical protein DVH24_037629 [Malus domestica]|uniref:Uncharacterized protein n=1 Tax=Malus domestica TaxID=3750 RepID=A0A498J0W3_MALDO|nr:hypothetical protein DVH24_037629 [Malus domestica]
MKKNLSVGVAAHTSFLLQTFKEKSEPVTETTYTEARKEERKERGRTYMEAGRGCRTVHMRADRAFHVKE